MLSLTPELLVEDLKKTIDWYSNNLGFEVLFVSPESGTPTFARVKKGNVEMMFYRRAEFADEIPSFKTMPTGGSFVLYLEVDDISSLWEELKTRATVVQSIHATDYGSQEFTIQDNSGYHLMFGERK